MRNRSFPVRILGWLAGVSLCLAATAAWAQPPDLGLPGAEGRTTPGFPSALWASWGRAIASRNSKPALPRRGPIDRPSCSSWQPCRPGPIPTRSPSGQADGYPRGSRSIRPQRFVNIGKFQTVGAPRSNTMRMRFRDSSWRRTPGGSNGSLPIQLVPGVKPETVKIEGKVNMQLAMPKVARSRRIIPFRPRCGPTSKRWPSQHPRSDGNCTPAASSGSIVCEFASEGPPCRPSSGAAPSSGAGKVRAGGYQPGQSGRTGRDHVPRRGWRNRLAAVHQCL